MKGTRKAPRCMAGLLLLTSMGCGLWNSGKKTSQEQHVQSLEEKSMGLVAQHKRSTLTESFSFRQDSSGNQYQIMIWPKGKIVFSADSGFRGEAERVLISGKKTAYGTAAAALQKKEQDTGKIALHTSGRKAVNSATTTLSTAPIPWWKWALALAGLLGLLVLYKKYNRYTRP